MFTKYPLLMTLCQTRPVLSAKVERMNHLLNKNLPQFFPRNYFVTSFFFTRVLRKGKTSHFTDHSRHLHLQRLPSAEETLVTSGLTFTQLYNNNRVIFSKFDSILAPSLIPNTGVRSFHCGHNCFNNSNINRRHLRFVKMVDSISEMVITPCEKSKYIKPLRLHYKQNGLPKAWDVVKNHDSVCVLLFNRKREVFTFVRQFRPIIYMNRSETYEEDGVTKIDSNKFTGKLGITTELCAGIVDKNLSLQEIVQEEIMEECGYKVPLDNIERVVSYRGGVSTTGACATLYYAEITDEMKVGVGGGVAEEGENIEIIEVPVSEARTFIMDDSIPKPSGIMFAVFWFFDTKWKK